VSGPARARAGLLLFLALGCRAAPAGAPRGLADDAGVPVPAGAVPRRVVSLIPATTELIFALGAGDRLVGRTSWCDYPAEALQVPDLGNGMTPNIEAVVGVHPDLVLLYRSASNLPAAGRFRAAGITTLELATDRMEDFERITRLLGTILGRAAQADSLIARTARDLAAATVHRPAAPSVFILVWDRPPMTLGRGSFLSEILARAGARNIFDDLPTSSAQVSVETVASRDPDFILSTSGADPAMASRPEWQPVRAVRERRFLPVHGSEFDRPGPRTALAVRELAAAIDSARR
jgi:ABC-type Fe3+-hydroxamate transport system substrate-binding protein